MDAKELDELLAKSKDKLNIFADREIISQYQISINELKDLINKHLNDTEKVSLLNVPHFNNVAVIKKAIIGTINDFDLIKEEIQKPENLQGTDIYSFINDLDSKIKVQILHDKDFLNNNKITRYKINNIFRSLDEDDKETLIRDKNFMINELGIQENQITEFLLLLKCENTKLEMIDEYEMNNIRKYCVLESLSDEKKQEILKDNKYELDNTQYADLASTLSPEELVKFFKDNKDYLNQLGIKPYNITFRLFKDSQVEFVSHIDETGLDLNEKRKILALLDNYAKEMVYDSRMPKEYTSALKMNLKKQLRFEEIQWKINVNFKDDMENYRGLDELIYLNPLEIPIENRDKIFELLEICPDATVSDNIAFSRSTAKEYIEGEKWIDSVIDGINPKWTEVEKVAYIDNVIGKNIRYASDYKTEVYNEFDVRALWKIISSKEGICNGISQMEKYILDRIGIKSEMVASENHAFLLLKDIPIPTKEGIKVGDTILDSTWNLNQNRFGSKPSSFCISYEEARKNDITPNGIDTESHLNEEKLSNVTLELDDDNLRQVYKNIGIADREGYFPVKTLLGKIENIKSNDKEAIEDILKAVKEQCPEFASCINATTEAVSLIINKCDNINFKECVANRVYSKQDKNKKPVMYLYASLKDEDEIFYVADKEVSDFISMNREDFEEKYECYEKDLEKNNGLRPWVKEEIEKEER